MGSRSACWSITRRAASGLRWGHSEHPAPGFCRRKTNTGQIPTKIQIQDKYTTLGSPGSTNMQRYDDPHLTTSGSWMLPTHTAGKSRRGGARLSSGRRWQRTKRLGANSGPSKNKNKIGSKQRWSKNKNKIGSKQRWSRLEQKQRVDLEQEGRTINKMSRSGFKFSHNLGKIWSVSTQRGRRSEQNQMSKWGAGSRKRKCQLNAVIGSLIPA